METRLHNYQVLLFFAAVTAAGVAAVSNQSFWIDEIQSATMARPGTWSQFIESATQNQTSDAQMPLYMVLLWGWGKFAGSSEISLRAINVVFFVAGLWITFRCLRVPVGQRIAFFLIACTSPFVWFYLDEARPYVLQFAGGCFLVVGFFNLAFDPRRERIAADAGVTLFGAIILCGASLLGVVYVFYFGLVFAWQLWRQGFVRVLLNSRAFSFILAATMIILGGFAAYYIWTLSKGARASAVGDTNLFTILFMIYEFLGFAGLGPSRLEMREAGPKALISHAPLLALYAAVLAFYLFYGLLRTTKSSTSWGPVLLLAVPCLAGLGTVLLAGKYLDFRVLGRHAMPVYPFLLLAFSFAMVELWRAAAWKKGLVVAFLGIGLTSAVTLRASHRHKKDDYRSAAEVGKQCVASGGVVWWSADLAGGHYYGLNVTKESAPVLLAINAETDQLKRLPVPDIAILSKGDIYDPSGSLRRYLKEIGLEVTRSFPAMSIWERSETLQIRQKDLEKTKL